DEAQQASLEPPDWQKVVDLACDALANNSKDLWIAAWLVEGLTRTEGFPGVRDGFRLIRELSERYWDGIHPRPDEDGIATTVAQLAGLNGDDAEGALIAPIKGIPITEGRSLPPFSCADYLQALELNQISDAKARQRRIDRGVPTLEMF